MIDWTGDYWRYANWTVALWFVVAGANLLALVLVPADAFDATMRCIMAALFIGLAIFELTMRRRADRR